jgi:hypothetical protein
MTWILIGLGALVVLGIAALWVGAFVAASLEPDYPPREWPLR